MGITGLLKELPGGDMKTSAYVGFDTLDVLRGVPVDIDTGTLIYACALRHKDAFNAGDYLPAAAEFQRQIISLNLLYKWDFTLVFDGPRPEEKRHENARRSGNDAHIDIKAEFIAMCVVVCQRHFFRFIVSPAEADMQVGRTRPEAVVVCRDSDEIAYGNRIVVIVDSWPKEEYRVIDMDAPVDERTRARLPLFFYFNMYGLKIIHWFAAVVGCDISESSSGIVGAGKAAFIKAMKTFDGGPVADLTPRSFAIKLREVALPSCRLRYSIRQVTTELCRVSTWFTSGGTYYDTSANVRSVDGRLLKARSPSSRRHMKGLLNSRTLAEFTNAEKQVIGHMQPHNLLHNSAAPRETIRSVALPTSRDMVAECRVQELKAMITAHCGGVTGRDGSDGP